MRDISCSRRSMIYKMKNGRPKRKRRKSEIGLWSLSHRETPIMRSTTISSSTNVKQQNPSESSIHNMRSSDGDGDDVCVHKFARMYEPQSQSRDTQCTCAYIANRQQALGTHQRKRIRRLFVKCVCAYIRRCVCARDG